MPVLFKFDDKMSFVRVGMEFEIDRVQGLLKKAGQTEFINLINRRI
jgi:hypothetical protein